MHVAFVLPRFFPYRGGYENSLLALSKYLVSHGHSGLGIETHDRAQYRYVQGQLQRSKKPVQLRGLNRNHNHDLKNVFKGTASWASSNPGPFQDFYVGLLGKGMKPEMARLTLARKIAAIALRVWKRGEHFDAKHLKQQAA